MSQPLKHDVRRAPKTARGFSLLEFLIIGSILVLLAMLVVPQFSSATKVSRESSLREDLNYLRNQVLLYRAQHHGVAPGFTNGDPKAAASVEAFVQQMTLYSDAEGHTAGAPGGVFKYGPYLTSLPANAINGSSQIRLLGPDAFLNEPVGTEGWLYQPATASIVSNTAGFDSTGEAFFNY